MDNDKSIKWCSHKGCEMCFIVASFNSEMSVECECGFETCLLCSNEKHMPAICDIRRIWEIKSNAESENLTWIIANTKGCPKCGKPIEKNQGCNHMHCQMCQHDFCWMCLGVWKDHGSATGGYYKCNKYDENKVDDKV